MGRTFGRSLAANLSLSIGLYIGLKAADKLMWDQTKCDQMKEQIEIDYWKKFGRPEHIEPELFKSAINPGEFYQTWLRARGRVEYMEEKVYKLH